MKVTVNKTKIEIFQGATVGDAIRAYYSHHGQWVPTPLPETWDAYGNLVAHDGALTEGNQLTVNVTFPTKRCDIFTLIVKKTGKKLNKNRRNMKKTTLLSLLVFLALTGCGTTKRGATSAVTEVTIIEREVTLLAVNDMHATIDNFPRLAFMVDSLRTIYPNMLLVSAGDNQTGNPVNDQYHEKGQPIIDLMNVVSFNLSAVGNHEFDVGVNNFATHTQNAYFDYLCANIKLPEGMEFAIKPYTIITMPNGLKVGFVSVLGLSPNNLPECHPDNLTGFSFTDPFETARKYLHLKDSTDLLIYITHLGFENDVKLVNSFPKGVVDLIIGGHSHTKVEKEQIHNDILITQAERKLKYATLIRFIVKSDGQIQRSMQLLPVGKTGSESAEIRAMVDEFNSDPKMQEVIAKAPYDFRTIDEVGYWMVDALKETAKTDIAVINKGGVRIDQLPAGDITRMTILTIDPFGNQVVTLNLTGHELKAFIVDVFEKDAYKLMYPAGMNLNYTVKEDDGLKLIDVELINEDGTPFDMDRTYSVATNSYIISIADFKREDPGKILSISTVEGWINWLLEEKTVKSYQEEKRVFINK